MIRGREPLEFWVWATLMKDRSGEIVGEFESICRESIR
jgi:hypothetical protein